ncbi:MAG TPA: hypothetical protein PLG41_24500, partial [Leptospiraceae bacterium]|nr:hypothetical protein [Leptospiraceae bacterium]
LFIYFIQHKELLGEKDSSYLSNKLKEFAKNKKNKFYTDFLSKLFFEGFAKKQTRPKEIEEALGKIPYLNGGLFQKHKLEILYPDIEIADKAFEKIFTYFDAWSWDLDEKKDTAENEINPDVLGYIFEKFTNQKQMGAYYTKEDITGYICKYTIIPWLLERANESKSMQSFFTKLLQADPDRYIYSAVSHGCKYDLPTEISKGIKNVSARTNWNTQAPEQFGLPTETWREVVARRQRYEEIKEKISPTSKERSRPFPTVNINDLITLNLNIIQFVLDAIEQGDLEFVQSLYNAIRSITILDPTCGSGAFLLAALNILEDIYEACLNRLAELDAKNPAIQEASSHANWKYFIYKSIILNNLYGVDIMEEAVEICKLRLFLKLISQVERDDNSPNLGIEPLPDIDFNIHAGNTLIGYTKLEDIEKSLLGTLNFYGNELKEIHKKAGDIDVIYDTFRKRQSAESGETSSEEPIQTIKERINSEMKLLNDKLDRFLAISYNISETEYKDKKKYEKDFLAWKLSHQPFHWVIEYYRIMKNGGFDVIVGNPPYVE